MTTMVPERGECMVFYDFEVTKHDWLTVMIDPFKPEVIKIINNPEGLRTVYEEHKKDTCEIMAVMTDGDAKTIMESNGLEMMRDMFRVFVVDGDVNAIFRPNAEIRGE